MTRTDVADYLVLKKVPFRDAHEIVGKLTAFCAREERSYPELSLAEFQRFSPAFDEDVFRVFDVATALRARKTTGSPSPARRTWNRQCRRATWGRTEPSCVIRTVSR